MTDLFDKSDVLTVLTLDKVKAGDEGYLGDCLVELNGKIKNGYIQSVTSIDQSDYILHPFKNERTNYALFLPVDKVKNKEPSYRPFNSVDELFDFLMPNFNKDSVYDQTGNKIEVDTNKKAVYLLGKKIILKKKENGQINALFIQHIKFNSDNSNVYLNNVSLDYIFHKYNIEKDDEWVTFGILEE